MGYGLGRVWCSIAGKHKWTSISKKERVSMIAHALATQRELSTSDIPGKRCTRCGLTKPVKSRQQKRDEAAKALIEKAATRYDNPNATQYEGKP